MLDGQKGYRTNMEGNLHIKLFSKGQEKTIRLPAFKSCQEEEFTCRWDRSTNGLALNIQAFNNLKIREISLLLDLKYFAAESVLVNGYQSWSESRAYTSGDSLKGLNPVFGPVNRFYRFKQYGDYWFTTYHGKKGHFHSHYFCILQKEGLEWLWISMDESQAFTLFEADLQQGSFWIRKENVEVPAGTEVRVLDVFQMQGPRAGIFEGFKMNLAPKPKLERPKSGWTSWYYHYENISEAILLNQLDNFAERQIPLDYFQIDDGYQKAIGDWEANEKFPNGMQYLADKIHESGYLAGIWMAPFVASSKSEILRKNPDWICKNQNGNPVIAGRVPAWGGEFYLLDLEKDSVCAYLEQCIRRAGYTWGFDLFKMDFLYAAALAPHREKSKAQLMTEAMDFLQACIPDKATLACGVPLGSAVGKTTFCRIGADVASFWEYRLLAGPIRYRERISTLSSIRSTLARGLLGCEAFGIDPDVYLLRDEKNKLSKMQKQTLFLVNQAFGQLLFTSDDISCYSPETFHQYCGQFPLLKRKVLKMEIHDALHEIEINVGKHTYLLLVNLNPIQKEYHLKNPAVDARGEIKEGTVKLAPWESKLFKIATFTPLEILWSDGHLFPGAEIRSLRAGVHWDLDLEAGSLNPTNNVFVVASGEAPPEDVHWSMDKRDWNGIEIWHLRRQPIQKN